ncbi:MAG: ribbon-helix-helix domain-containing protein [Candidatus Woesearchaeota archaeon]
MQPRFVIHSDYSDMSKSQQEIEVVNIRLPDEILSRLDALVKGKIFSSRSEAVRAFCREYVEEAHR